MKDKVNSILKEFEAGAISDAEAVRQIDVVTARSVDLDHLRNYWRGESKEDFVDRLCAAPITDWREISEARILELIAEFLATESPGRRDSIGVALERRLGKPSGTLLDVAYHRDNSEPEQILEELKKETRIFFVMRADLGEGSCFILILPKGGTSGGRCTPGYLHAPFLGFRKSHGVRTVLERSISTVWR